MPPLSNFATFEVLIPHILFKFLHWRTWGNHWTQSLWQEILVQVSITASCGYLGDRPCSPVSTTRILHQGSITNPLVKYGSSNVCKILVWIHIGYFKFYVFRWACDPDMKTPTVVSKPGCPFDELYKHVFMKKCMFWWLCMFMGEIDILVVFLYGPRFWFFRIKVTK